MAPSNSTKKTASKKGTASSRRRNLLDLQPFYDKLEQGNPFPVTMRGRVKKITGMVINARLPNARIGELCTIEPPGRKPVFAQVVGFDDEDVFLTPLDPVHQIGPKTAVVNRGEVLQVGVGPELLGRVVDSLGKPIDKRGPIDTALVYPVRQVAPSAMKRRRISKILPVGVRAIDTMLTVGEGQRIGVFSTAGVGKSSLLGMIARNSTADVNVVALVGERGREVLDFLEDNLGDEGLKRSIVVVSTSNEPPLRRIMAAYTATAIAEYFRDQGQSVMLLMDSVTRFARAMREIALSVGEPPARQGYPPSVFAALPELLERAGNTDKGSITAFYTILLSTEQIEDPLGEEIRAILDGHLYLSSRLSQVQHFPAIDLLKSNSRLMDKVASEAHNSAAEDIRKLWAVYEENRDLISIGAYKRGSDPLIDEAIGMRTKIADFLIQRQNEAADFEDTLQLAQQLLDRRD
ncbi:MAG: FliI/YscN family ATPase [Bdellovibrionales bacterium]|nr:FliI/YscN family ATPase [Bdellovibrionales bacterium]